MDQNVLIILCVYLTQADHINIPYTQNEMKYLAMMDLTMGKCSYEEFITKMKNL
jgi:hypothetical protein